MVAQLHYLLLLVFECVFPVVSAFNKIHIVNASTERFEHGLGDEVVQWGMIDVGSNYEIVAIIGPQSSGKSTLLNNVFGTDFTVMDPKAWGQTTRGIWISRDKTRHVIVMDVEGSDGGIREDDQKFERKSALFALACSRLLIVNIWENQVGLYNGANMGLLKIVFEEYLALYGNLDRHVYQWPKIIFVIQAHSSGISLASLAETITQSLNRLWDSIQKPEELENKTLQDYFDFSFESLPHIASKLYKPQVNLLRKRIVERESTQYIFNQQYPNTVHVDDLEVYMKAIWETIRTNENLNLPGQHELLARAMCNKIAMSLLQNYSHQIASQLSILDEGTVINDLALLMQSWKSEILAQYDQGARRYVQPVYAKTRDALIDSYYREITILFTKQLRNLRISLLAAFDKVLEDAVSKNDAEFAATTSSEKQRYEDNFTAAARNTAIGNDANWDWTHEFKELQSGIAFRIHARKMERRMSTPIYAAKNELVSSGKLVSTKATLYRDGNLRAEVYTSNKQFSHALRWRVVIAVFDENGTKIAEVKLHCTLRGGWGSESRSGTDTFYEQFGRDVGRQAERLNIYQMDA